MNITRTTAGFSFDVDNREAEILLGLLSAGSQRGITDDVHEAGATLYDTLFDALENAGLRTNPKTAGIINEEHPLFKLAALAERFTSDVGQTQEAVTEVAQSVRTA